MDNSTKYFIDLLSSFLCKHEPIQKDNIEWNEIMKFARIHNVSGMIYLAANKLPCDYSPSTDIKKMLEKDFLVTALRAESRDNGMEALIDALNEAKIPHVLIKGYVVKNYYPVKEMRTMGDIDFLIRPQDRAKSHELLQSIGFITGEAEDEVWHYSNNAVNLEVHTQIMYHNMHNGTDYVKYFSDAWEHTIPTSRPYTFELTVEYHFLYVMVHLAKHFDGKGCGIRMIMDIAVFLNFFKGKLDWAYINREIENLNLVLFSKNIYILCKRWFGLSFDFKLPEMEENFYEDLSDYILSAGTFGFYERDSSARVIRTELYQGNSEAKKTNKKIALIKIYISRLFPGYKEMCNGSHYKFLSGRPILLPIAWIYRFFRLAKDVGESNKEAEKQYEVISKLGL